MHGRGVKSTALGLALSLVACSAREADPSRSPLVRAISSESPRAPASVATSAATNDAVPTAPSLATSGEAPAAPLVLRTPSGIALRVARGVSLEASPVRTITALHGMCYTGEDLCTMLRPLADGRGVLVCPTGNGACPDGSPDWIIPTAASAIRESTVTAFEALGEPARVPHADVLFGSSRGAYAACQIVYDTHEGPWSALVLVGASVDPDPARLARGGIKRVLLAAPEFDVAAPNMRRAQKKLCRAGLPARFVDLGAHGHGLPEEGIGILANNMDWVLDRSETTECRGANGPAPNDHG